MLKKSDPTGSYYLKTKPLSYVVEGAPEGAREFDAFVIIPSSSKTFWEHSSKIVSIDMAHNRNMSRGLICKKSTQGLQKLFKRPLETRK